MENQNKVWTPRVGDRCTVKYWQGIGTIHSIPRTGIARILFDDHIGRAEVPFHELTKKELEMSKNLDQSDETIARNNRAAAKHELLGAFPGLSDTQAADLSSYKPELSLEQCYAMAHRMSASLLLHKRANPDSANLEQSEDFACGIVLNLASEIRNQYSYEAHPAICPCDDCSAARSDEHHDRKRDGMLA